MSTNNLIGGFVAWGFIATVVFLWVVSIIWAFRDARRRGKSGLLVALVVIVLPWPIGFLAWLVFRPTRDRRRSLPHRGPI